MSSRTSGVRRGADRDDIVDQTPQVASADGGSRWFYGWLMLPLATMALIATAPGQTFSVSAFNDSFRQSLGLSHSQLTGAYMLGTFLASLPMSYVGALMDRHGLRNTTLIVVILFGAVCVLTSQVTGPITLFFAFLFLRMLGAGALGLLSGNVLAFWFDRKLGTVEGLRHFGMAGAIAVVPAFNLWLIDAVGWRMAYAVLGLIVWAMMIPVLVWLWRDRPEHVGQHKDGVVPEAVSDEHEPAHAERQERRASLSLREALATRSYWIMLACMASWSMIGTAFFFNIVPFFDQRGMGSTEVAWLFTSFAVTLAVMHIVGGMLADRIPLNVLLSVAMGLLTAAIFVAWRIETAAGVYPLGMLLGVAQGLIVACIGPVWPRYYGRAALGRIRGSATTALVAASSVGPFLMGVGFDLGGSYDMVMLGFVMLLAPLAVLALVATVPRQRRRRLARVGPM